LPDATPRQLLTRLKITTDDDRRLHDGHDDDNNDDDDDGDNRKYPGLLFSCEKTSFLI
jgi:hypothetical protein